MRRPDDPRPLVLHVVFRFDVGGLENGVANLINHMPADAYRHAILALTEVTDFRKRISRQDVEFISLHKPEGHLFPLYPQLFRLFRKLRPAIVHSRNLAALEVTLPAWAAGVPVRIQSEHGRDHGDLDGSNPRHRKVRRFYDRFVSHYVALSRDLERWLVEGIGLPAGKVTQIYNGVDATRFHPADGRTVKHTHPSPSIPIPLGAREAACLLSPLAGERPGERGNWRHRGGDVTPPLPSPLPQGDRGDLLHSASVISISEQRLISIEGCPFLRPGHWMVGTVGRMQTVKDQTVLARAFIRALELDPLLKTRLRLVMVGEGPLRAEAQQMLEHAGVADLAWLPGERNDVPSIMRGLDCFVLPSLAEGISNTILEAMASGLPVIATRVGGSPELIVESRTGELVPASNVEALARVLVSYANRPEQASSAGRAGRADVEQRFSLDAMVGAYRSLYDRLLSAAPRKN
jgi:glycosyltransferase involved in cell wall biosynthesis